MNADNTPIAPPVPEPSTMPLLLSGVPILVGVSGGRDSIALLTLLAELPGCRPIACHVHHGIRKCTADADAKFTEAYARKLGIPFLVEYMDAPRVAHRDGLSLETAARKLRQECFALWHSRFPESMAALAHHRDDQAETAIFHLCRGTRRLRAMTPVSTWPGGMTVLRPLLDTSRQQITNWLTLRSIPWQEDETNAETDIVRNAIRLQIIPSLSSILKRDVTPIINRSARLAEEQEKALDQALELMELTDPQGRLFLPKINAMPAELKKAAVFRFLKKNGVPDLSEECIARTLDILNVAGPSRTSLPGGLIASRKEHRLVVVPSGERRQLPDSNHSSPKNNQ